ncbi:MAG: NUDIX domain-containing protein, partial [Rhodospirillaceae bacterium]
LGATVCKPKAADCVACPLTAHCRATQEADPARYPLRAAKKARPTRYGVVFWAERADGRVLLRRRPNRGLLGGMMEFPSTEWRDAPWPDGAWNGAAPPGGAIWSPRGDTGVHGVTHFRLGLRIVAGRAHDADTDGVWCHPDDFAGLALPTLMKKVAGAAAVNDGG